MHGFGSNAQEQQLYSEMDQFAHSQNIAVVYPQGFNNSWNVRIKNFFRLYNYIFFNGT